MKSFKLDKMNYQFEKGKTEFDVEMIIRLLPTHIAFIENGNRTDKLKTI